MKVRIEFPPKAPEEPVLPRESSYDVVEFSTASDGTLSTWEEAVWNFASAAGSTHRPEDIIREVFLDYVPKNETDWGRFAKKLCQTDHEQLLTALQNSR
jgi:hypothetical protein